MRDMFKSLFDFVFSFGMFMACLSVLFVWGMITLFIRDNERKELRRAATSFCYNQHMIAVDTDAGRYCVKPENLVKTK